MTVELNTKLVSSTLNHNKVDSSFQRTVNFIRSQVHAHPDLRSRLTEGARAIAEHFCAPYLVLKLDLEGRPFEHTVHFGDIPTETWEQLSSVPLLECISSQKPQANFFAERKSGTKMAILTLPLHSNTQGPVGVACIAIQTSDATAAKQHLNEFENLLNVLTGVTVNWSPSKSQATPSSAPASQPPESQANTSSFLQQLCNGKYWEDSTALAFYVVNGLCKELQCLDVSLGIVVNHRVRLLAISGHDSVYRRSPGCVGMEQAMMESLDCGQMILVQSDSPEGPIHSKLNCGLHRTWRANSGNSACLSVPLIHEEEVVAICSFRREENLPFTSVELAYIEQYQAKLAELITLSQKLNRSLWDHFRGNFAKASQRYLGSTVRKVAVLSLFAVTATCLLFPWPHSINVPCKLVSASPRVYSAPFAGKVKKVHFRNGDLVKAGAILFEMENDELLMRKSKLEVEMEARQQAMIRFLQNDETAKAGEEQSNLEVIRNELQILETKLSDACVRAEEDGTIFDSDLFKREGEMVAIGEQLLNFAPIESQHIELQIPDYLGMEIQAGQQGLFATSAEPDRWHTIAVERVETASVSENGENIIKAIGNGNDLGTETKLGMSGFAQVSVGKQAGWWILLQKPIRYMQRKVWQL